MKENWNGNGLPPIGTKVMTDFPQARHKSAMQSHGKEAEIVAHADDIAIFKYEHEGCKYYHGFYAGHFLPIKSDRDKFIEDLMELFHAGFNTREKFCGDLYDAGYRKVKSEE